MTILDALSWGTQKIRETLHEKKTDAHVPAYDAQVLLAHTLAVRTSFLFAHGNDVIENSQWETYRGLIERRAAHEPISQLLQSAVFRKREFYINRHVLTPRPETEELVELALARPADAYVDIGTGSGIIGITLALETGKPVFAIDVDARALAVARRNWEILGDAHTSTHASPTKAPVTFHEGNLLEPLRNDSEFQALQKQGAHITYVANLPYIPTGARKDIDPDVLSYEPHHALFSGIDGLEDSIKLLRQISPKFPFSLFMELDVTNVALAAKITHALFPRATVEIHADLSGKPRFLAANLYL